ncbi:MAG: HNH endonuclease [Crenarchaeota archaeon]|nr:MAG: HNH endonuclease [Thermoproteota archaeon]
MGKRLSRKQLKKRTSKKCYFCDCDEYELLDVHRIVPGEEGGKYNDFNTLVCCALCHRKIHSNKIQILGKYYSTAGRYILYYINEEGKEMWE